MSSKIRSTSVVLFGLFLCVILVPLLAGWLNVWSVYAFPLGTLVTALFVPVAVLMLAGHYIGVVDAPAELDDAP